MICYHAKEFESAAPRVHPWTRAVSDPANVYVDFKENPKLIRESLEDWAPLAGESFVQAFYSLLEWLNGRDSVFETNDCAFVGVIENETDRQFPYPFKCQGRLMILFRDIAENCQPKSIEWLMSELSASIRSSKPGFNAGAIGLSRMQTAYAALGDGKRKGAKGEQVMLSFFAYGKNEARCYESMEKVIEAARTALERANRKTKAGAVDALYG